MPNNLTLSSPTYTSGKFGNAIAPGGGAAPYAKIPQAVFSTLNSTNTGTIEAWVKQTAADTAIRIAVGDEAGFWFGSMSGNAVLSYGSGGTVVTLTPAVAINTGVPIHMAVSFSSGGAKLFVNGTLAASSATTFSGAGGAVNSNGVGIMNFETGVGPYTWSGYIDEVAVWSTAKYSSTFTPPTVAYSGSEVGLIALYHLDSNGTDSIGTPANMDRVTTGGVDLLMLKPVGYTGSTATGLVFYHSGHGEDREAWLTDTLKDGLRNRLLTDGYLLAGISPGTAHWGNAAAVAKYAIGHAYALANYNVSKVFLIGQSMGGLTALQALRDPTSFARVCGFAGIYPACDIRSIYDLGAYTSEIKTAFGIASDGSDYPSKVYGHDPIALDPTGYPPIRYRFWASTSDTVVPSTTNATRFNELLKSTYTLANTLTATSGDHGDTSNFDPSAMSTLVAAALADTIYSAPILVASGTAYGPTGAYVGTGVGTLSAFTVASIVTALNNDTTVGGLHADALAAKTQATTAASQAAAAAASAASADSKLSASGVGGGVS